MLSQDKYLNLINAVNSRGQTPLYCACNQGHLEIVVHLLVNGASPDFQVSKHGGTPLHTACYSGHLEVASALLLAGADPFIENNMGIRPHEEATGKTGILFKVPQPKPEELVLMHPLLTNVKNSKKSSTLNPSDGRASF
eukprot:TRINITY_DN1519_c0_g1_i35.p2 TRINITY_DN1519_c0_g1~~TRINITY_DN1519_c0_g1_i35.p2  ORF type:complete len:139 (-),score=31.41 TRINITY_DN1519_c0_g1_i35:116-532(-)